jgi:hypothetical protein
MDGYISLSYSDQGCTTPGRLVAVRTEFCTVAPNVRGSSVWNSLHVTLRAPGILRFLVDFMRTSAPLDYATVLLDAVICIESDVLMCWCLIFSQCILLSNDAVCYRIAYYSVLDSLLIHDTVLHRMFLHEFILLAGVRCGIRSLHNHSKT